MFRKLRNENINGVYFTENEVSKKLHTVMKEYFDFDIHLSPEWFSPYVKIRSFSECTAEDWIVYEGMNELSLFEEKLNFNMRHLVDNEKTGFDNTVLFIKMLDKSIKD